MVDSAWLLVRALLGLGVVLAAIVLAGRGLARLQHRQRGGRMEMLGGLALGGRRSLALVKVGQRALVLGVGEREVTCLYAFEDPAEVAELAGEGWMSLEEAERAAAQLQRTPPAGATTLRPANVGQARAFGGDGATRALGGAAARLVAWLQAGTQAAAARGHDRGPLHHRPGQGGAGR